jgi:hypothetical protein
LEAWEKDIATSDFLGSMKEVPWSEFVYLEGVIKHNVDIFDERG